jgi:TolB-like protein/DNA-binding SARP family transcriptional activator/cytochrome c-type biogenesis protein CcmH/NrfG
MNTAPFPGSEAPVRWSLRLLGDFQLSERSNGEKVTLPGKRERVLLAYLALSPNGRQPRRRLVTLLWGEAADETTLDNLRTSVFNLRKALGDTERSIVASDDRDIVLDLSKLEVDVLTLRRLAGGSAVAELEEAAKLYAGDFLEGLSIESEEFESWRREEATRCKRQVLDALTRLMAQLSASAESERAIEAALRILRLEPLNESAVRHLMRLYAEGGHRATAVELYRILADSLKKELGAQPGAETRAVFADISRGETAPRAAAAPDAAPAPNPPALSPSATLVPAKAASAHPGNEALVRRPHARDLAGVAAAKRNWILAGGLAGAAAVATLLFITLAPSTGPAPTGQPATVIAATPTSAIALAVLPFANLSDDPQQEFFSDGLTDEITSTLARIPDLGVVARTSAFQFKGQNRDLRAVGQSLGATHLIEGSVRRAGDQVRITAQLIQADNGLHIWTATYDRNLADIFAIQEEIARAIAASLRMPLGLQPGRGLFPGRDIDSQSYEQYLAARAAMRSANQDVARRAAVIESLEHVVARHPGFAPAWAAMALAYFRRAIAVPGNPTVAEMRRSIDEWGPKAEAAARRAIELDPNLPDGYALLGITIRGKEGWAQMEELYSRALALDPLHPDTMHFYATYLGAAGRVKEAIAMRERLMRIEPLVGLYTANYEEMLWVDGQEDALNARLRERPRNAPGFLSTFLGRMYAAQGRYAEAADAVKTAPRNRHPEGAVEAAERLLRTVPISSAGGSVQRLPRLDGGTEGLDFVYVHVGAPELVMQEYEDSLAGGAANIASFVLLWHPSYAPVRKTERFKAHVRAFGLVDYWRAKGWPDLCRPVGSDDFTCG